MPRATYEPHEQTVYGQPETTIHAIIGQVLRNLRKQHRAEALKKKKDESWDQDFVAAKMGLNRSSYSRIESGETVLNAEQLYQLNGIFNLGNGDAILEKAHRIAKELGKRGYTVHYKTAKKLREGTEANAAGRPGSGWAIIGGAVLGALVASLLVSRSK